MISAVIVSYKREANIPKIIQSLSHPAINEIVVFNNNPNSTADFKNCVHIKSNKNYKCWTKYAIGSMLINPYVLSIDDDLMLNRGTVDQLLQNKQLVDKGCNIGFFGLNLVNDSYSNGQKFKSTEIKENKRVDILLGRLVFSSPLLLSQALHFRNSLPNYQNKSYLAGEGEDIILSLATHENYLLAANKEQAPIELPELGQSLHKRQQHKDNRNQAVIDALNFLRGSNV